MLLCRGEKSGREALRRDGDMGGGVDGVILWDVERLQRGDELHRGDERWSKGCCIVMSEGIDGGMLRGVARLPRGEELKRGDERWRRGCCIEISGGIIEGMLRDCERVMRWNLNDAVEWCRKVTEGRGVKRCDERWRDAVLSWVEMLRWEITEERCEGCCGVQYKVKKKKKRNESSV